MKPPRIIRSAVYGLCFVCCGSVAVSVSYALDASPAPTNVPVISGPFKGERAKVVRTDKEKDDVTVELIEVAVPIPVTIKTNTIRVVEQAKPAA